MSILGIGDIELLAVIAVVIFLFGRKQLVEWVRSLKLMKYQWEKPLTEEEKKTIDVPAKA